MTTRPDPDQLIRAYLDEGSKQLPDRTYDAVREQIDRTRQRAFLGSIRGLRVPGVPRLAMAVAAVVVLAVVGMNLPPARDGMVGGGPTGLPSSTGTPPPSAVATPRPTHEYLEVVPGSYEVPWPQGRIRLTMPAGWSSAGAGWEDCPGVPCWPSEAGTTLTRYGPEFPSPTLTLNLVHDVTSVVADVCVEGGEERLVEVGPTVEDLTTALVNQIGVQRSRPMDVTLGGYPARKFVLTMPSAELFCPGPEGKRVWANGMTNGFWLLKDGTATIYVVDVNGDRLVVTSLDRGSPAEDVAQLDAIIASMVIEPSGVYPTGNRNPQGDLPVGSHSLTVEGVRLSFSVPTPGWERFGSISLNKSTVGPQGAEGIIYWTGFPDGVLADLCPDLISLPAGASALDLAAAVATAPGTELVSGPLEVTVGGRAALHAVITVREDVGCDPGFFYAWQDADVGALWTRTDVGDTIRIWVVDVDGTRLFIVGGTNVNFAKLDEEIQQIVDSIQFE